MSSANQRAARRMHCASNGPYQRPTRRQRLREETNRGLLLRRAAYVFGGSALLGLLLLGVGAIYQALSEAYDLYCHPPPGRLVDVGGHRLHIYCVGEGDPTVVLESGLAGLSPEWSLVQPEIARFTRVCAYDRAGNGWSDPGPKPRTPERVTDELHTLLQRVGIAPPIVLVGHSLGGIHVRVYAGKYPREVAGIVLIDAQPEDLFRWELKRGWDDYKGPILAWLGVKRLRRRPGGFPPIERLPVKLRETVVALGLRSHAYDWILWEGPAVKETADQVRRFGALKDIPLVVLSSRRPDPEDDRSWQSVQEKLARLSPRGRHVIAERSGHYIHLDQPELVTEAVREVVTEARSGPPRSQ